MRLLFVPLAIVVASVISPSVHAQTVHLKNGNTLHGEVEYPNEQQVLVDIPGVGKLTFERTEIVSIEESSDYAPSQGTSQPSLTPHASVGSQRQATKPNPHCEQAKSLYRQKQYEQAEAKAQRALEYAIGNGDKATAQAMRQLIRESRALQSEQRQKDREREAVEKQEQERKAAEERKQRALEEERQQQEKRNAEYRRAMCQSDCRATCDNFPEEQREYFPGGYHNMYPRQGCLRLCQEKC